MTTTSNCTITDRNDNSKTNSIYSNVRKMKLSHSNIPQHPHINELLTTAAAANGIVGDVDALLTPMPSPPNPNPPYLQPLRSAQRPERNLWNMDEIIHMLRIMQQMRALESLNDKNIKSEKIFRNVEVVMKQRGYHKKSHAQIWTKWKFLKSTYTTSKRNGVIPKMIPPQVYEVLDEMLSGIGYGGVSEATSMTDSLDGEISNGRLPTTATSCVDISNAGQENPFDMKHPIFGSRLGFIKQEPMDIDFQTPGKLNSSDESGIHQQVKTDLNESFTSEGSSRLNISFQTEIKVEANNVTASPKTQISREVLNQSLLKDADLQKPKKLAPRAAIVTPLKPLLKNCTATPLRIAPFAKEPRPNAMELLRYPSAPPALRPYASQPMPMHHNISNAGVINVASGNSSARGVMMNPPRPIHKSQTILTQQMLRPLSMKPPQQLQQQTDQKFRPRTQNPLYGQGAIARGLQQKQHPPVYKMPTNPNQLRLKQVPLRPTPYSLRPERLIPNLHDDSSNSPPLRYQPPQQQQHHYQKSQQLSSQPQHTYQHSHVISPDMPTTSQQALKSSQQQQQNKSGIAPNKPKRRLDIPWLNTNTQPKIPKMSLPPRNQSQRPPDRSHNAIRTNTLSNRQQRRRARALEFEKNMKEISFSLRNIQREALADFFKHQIELTRKDHEFQMKQDSSLLEAFQKQSNQLKKVAKKLIGVDLDKIMHEEVKDVQNQATEENGDESTKTNQTQMGQDETDMEEAKTSHENALKDLASERKMGSAAATELLKNQLSNASVESDYENDNAVGVIDNDNNDDDAEESNDDEQHKNVLVDRNEAAAMKATSTNVISSNSSKNMSSSSEDDDDDDSDNDENDNDNEVDKEKGSEVSDEDDDDDCEGAHIDNEEHYEA